MEAANVVPVHGRLLSYTNITVAKGVINMSTKRIVYSILHVFLMLWCYYATFLAAIYDAFEESKASVTYFILYGLMLLPVCLFTALSWREQREGTYFYDVTELMASVVAICVLLILGSRNDFKFVLPWLILLANRIGIMVWKRKTGSRSLPSIKSSDLSTND